MDTSQRHGAHPLDAPLQDSNLLEWLAPAFGLLRERVLQIAPFALALVLLTWLTPYISIAGPMDEGWRSAFDGFVHSVLSTAIIMTGYAHLARSEGGPWGVGALLGTGEAVLRLAIVVVIWAALGWLIGQVFSAILGSAGMTRLLLRLFMTFDVYAVYLLILALSPVFFMLAAASVITHIGAIRGREPVPALLLNSLRAVFGQPGRFIKPSFVIAGALIAVLHLLLKLLGARLLPLFFTHGQTLLLVLVFATALFALPWWFVMERALRPELGVEDDLDPVADSDSGADAGIDDPSAATTAAAATATGVDAMPAQVAARIASDGVAAATQELVDGLRHRRLDREAFLAGVDALPADAPLAAGLSALAEHWQDSASIGDLAWLVRIGLKRDKAFLMERPDPALAVAQRLVGADQPQLASHLLLAFVNRQHGHAAHRDAGLRLARLLAFQLDNADGARRLLERLLQGYPDDAELLRLGGRLP